MWYKRQAGAVDLGLGRERDACQERLDEAVARLRRHEARVRAFIDLTSSAGEATKNRTGGRVAPGSPEGFDPLLINNTTRKNGTKAWAVKNPKPSASMTSLL